MQHAGATGSYVAAPSHAPRMSTTNRVLGTFLFVTRDQPGLVARVATFFYERSINIVESANSSDAFGEGPPKFFLRMSVDLTEHPASADGALERKALEDDFEALAVRLGATWSVGYSDVVARVAVLVTREDACLYDLVLRQRQGELCCEIPLVISNHPALEAVAQRFGIPYHTLPVSDATRRDQEIRILALLQEHRVDLVVLARYMQVVSEDFLGHAPPVINIHHGFLPAFQGPRPYHQAYCHGVKFVGATAHYATRDLDQGPIIEQDVVRVDHRMGPADLARVGRDVERIVLSRAVRAHLERRIIVDGRRTVVL
jgi:formyltetrahydrofolate deformylase